MSQIDDFINNFLPKEKAELNRIRQIVKSVAPGAEEVISYGIAGFKYKGKYLCGYSAFKNHISFFPTSTPIEKYKKELEHYKISKGTIQFSAEFPLTDELIKKLINYKIELINNKNS